MRLQSFIKEGRGKSISRENVIDLIKTKCNKALKYFSDSGNSLFRGVGYEEEYIYVNPKSSERTSAYTDNYYTLIFDNDHRWNSYPKRSQSMICTTSYQKSRRYGYPYRIFPYDGSRYGVCPKKDIWESFTSFGSVGDLNFVNVCIRDLGAVCDINIKDTKTYQDFIKKLEDISNALIVSDKKIQKKNKLYWSWIKTTNKTITFKDWVISLYDPNKNDFYFTEDISKIFSSGEKSKEVWTDGECIMVEYRMDSLLLYNLAMGWAESVEIYFD